MEVASRFSMRSRVRLKLTQSTGEVTVAEGLVAWARVSAILDKQVNYLVAVIFDNAIHDFGGLDASPVIEAAIPQIAEAPAAVEAAAPGDNLRPFPTTSFRGTAQTADSWSEAEEYVISLDTESDPTQAGEAIGQAAEHLVALSAANDTLVARLAAREQEHARAMAELLTRCEALQSVASRGQGQVQAFA